MPQRAIRALLSPLPIASEGNQSAINISISDRSPRSDVRLAVSSRRAVDFRYLANQLRKQGQPSTNDDSTDGKKTISKVSQQTAGTNIKSMLNQQHEY